MDTADHPNVHPLHEPVSPPRPAVQTESLCVYYGAEPALCDVSMEVPQGGITALIGPSGCGKSSLLMTLNRLTDLVPECRVTGCIRVAGEDINAPGTDVTSLRRRVGKIFQRPNPFPLSIRRNIELGLKELGIRHRDDLDEAVESSLRAVGLWDEVKQRLDQSALLLSGGQRQRLCIARAIALKPRLLLMDEPCSALDPISSGVVEELIIELGREYTVVIVTHNLAQARRVSHHTGFFWLKDCAGRLIEFDRTETLFESPTDPLTQAYIEGRRG